MRAQYSLGIVTFSSSSCSNLHGQSQPITPMENQSVTCTSSSTVRRADTNRRGVTVSACNQMPCNGFKNGGNLDLHRRQVLPCNGTPRRNAATCSSKDGMIDTFTLQRRVDKQHVRKSGQHHTVSVSSPPKGAKPSRNFLKENLLKVTEFTPRDSKGTNSQDYTKTGILKHRNFGSVPKYLSVSFPFSYGGPDIVYLVHWPVV